MTRLLLDEVDDALAEETGDDRECHLVLATGVLAGPFMKRIVAQVQQKFPGIHVDVRVIRNDFFGEKITVAGISLPSFQARWTAPSGCSFRR